MSPRLSDLLLSSQSDERLVSLARAGHERAFVVIVERYRSELHALARRLCPDGRSEDVVQQAFLSAFTALRSGSEVRHLRGWLYQIVRNAAGRPQAPHCVPLDGATASASTVEEVVQQRVLAMSALSEIGRLPANQRQAMIGTALDGRPRAEIASSMGLSEGAVRQLVHRARTTLRGAVTALTPWPLSRWIVAVGPDAPAPASVAAGAGTASSGGLVLKLGALLASGTFLTGAAVHLDAPKRHRTDERAAVSAHAGPAVARAHPQMVGAAARSVPFRELLPVPHPAGAGLVVHPRVAHVGATKESVRNGRHDGMPAGSGERLDGSPVDGRDGGRGDRTDPTRSSGTGEGGGPGGGGGTRTDGRDGPGGGTGSDGGGGTQMVSDAQPIDSSVDGSGSSDGSAPGASSGSDGGSASGTDGGPGAGLQVASSSSSSSSSGPGGGGTTGG